MLAEQVRRMGAFQNPKDLGNAAGRRKIDNRPPVPRKTMVADSCGSMSVSDASKVTVSWFDVGSVEIRHADRESWTDW